MAMAPNDLDEETSASRVLTNYFLLSMIFAQLKEILDPGIEVWFWSKGMADAFKVLASTCKIFSEAALPHIWEDMPSLLPLLELLPGFCLRNRSYITSSLNEPRDFARFDRCTTFVKAITIKDHRYPISALVLTQILLRRTDSPIFPCLQQIRFSDRLNDSSMSWALALLTSPSLEEVHFGAGSLEMGPNTYLLWERLLDVTSLQRLTIKARRMTEIPWDIVARLSRLQRVEINSDLELDHHVVTALRRLPDISHLLLNVPAVTHPPTIPVQAGFKKLVDLTIPMLPGPVDLQLALVPLRGVTTLQLVEGLMRVWNPGPNDWQIMAVCLAVDAASLRNLYISSYGRIRINLNDIQAFIAIPNIRTLTFDRLVLVTPDVGQSDLLVRFKQILNSTIARASNSRQCNLSELYFPERLSGPAMGFDLLLYISRYAKHFTSLRLPFDSSLRIPRIPDRSSGPVPCSPSLILLELVDQRATEMQPEEYRPIAAFLDVLFPNARTPLGRYATVPHGYRHWGAINALRKAPGA